MKKNTLLFTAAIMISGLGACSDKSADTPIALETKEVPTIDMVATHDIALDISVSQLTFVPNSVAPWLGRIIVLDDNGRLYSTDIEGRDPKPISHSGSSSKYIDIFGLAREAAPGVFLAITEDNKIEAFIEADDIGNFSPMIYSGEKIASQAFCLKKRSINNEITVLTKTGEFKTLNLVISENTMRQEVSNTRPSQETSPHCQLHYAPIAQNAGNYNVAKGEQSGIKIHKYDPAEQEFLVNITNGLSVRGAKHIKFIATTQSNYGGGAYADGVLALVDADEQRIVFISLSYAEGQLMKAVNPPGEALQ
jgi:hypothetical protein